MARDWIRQLRLKQSLNQTQLAKKALLAAARLSRIESGYCDMTDEDVRKLAIALGVSGLTVRGETPPAEPEAASLKKETPNHVTIPNPQPQATNHPPSPPAMTYSLSDPANYRQEPDRSILELNGSSAVQHKATLRAALLEAEKVLHTSRVPADIWRQWRAFEKLLREKIRVLTAS